MPCFLFVRVRDFVACPSQYAEAPAAAEDEERP